MNYEEAINILNESKDRVAEKKLLTQREKNVKPTILQFQQLRSRFRRTYKK